ncbi:hypothetical protein BG011_001679, partial [Mortierella polycephala]
RLEAGAKSLRISSSHNPAKQLIFPADSSSKYHCPICSKMYVRRSVKNHVADCHYNLFQEQAGISCTEATEPHNPHEVGVQSQLDGPSLLPLMTHLFSGFTQWLQFNPAGQHELTDATGVLVPADARLTHKIPDREELLTIGKGGQAGLAIIA